jgi:hypothetical protein
MPMVAQFYRLQERGNGLSPYVAALDLGKLLREHKTPGRFRVAKKGHIQVRAGFRRACVRAHINEKRGKSPV